LDIGNGLIHSQQSKSGCVSLEDQCVVLSLSFDRWVQIWTPDAVSTELCYSRSAFG